jgi:Flp pilus assembly protein TadD
VDKQTQIILDEKEKKKPKDQENTFDNPLVDKEEDSLLDQNVNRHQSSENEIDLSDASSGSDIISTQPGKPNRSNLLVSRNLKDREESPETENRISVIDPDDMAYQAEYQPTTTETEKESGTEIPKKKRSGPFKSKEKKDTGSEIEERKPNRMKTAPRRTGLKPLRTVSQPINTSKGVAYFKGSMIKIAGGVKLSPGDGIRIKDKEFVLRSKQKKPTILYGLAAVAALIGLILITPLFRSHPSGKLFGVVIEESSRLFIPQAKIYLKEAGKTINANPLGFFVLETIPPGQYTLETSYPGYQTKRETVTITRNQVTTISTQLAPVSSLSGTPYPSGSTRGANQETATSDMSSAESDFGAVRIRSNLTDPVILVDDKEVGSGNKVYRKITPGAHTIIARKEGYFDWAGEVKVNPGQTLNLDVELTVDKNYHPAPQTASDFVTLGKSQVNSGDYASALISFNQALNLKPDSPEALMGRGSVYLQAGDKTKAVEDLDKAGRVFFNQADYRSAVLCFNDLLTLNDQDPSYSLNRGICFLEMGQYQNSIPDLKKAVKLDDRLFPGFLNLGEAYYQNGDSKLAVETYQKARKLNPKSPEVYVGLTKANYAKGDKSEAKKSYKKFEELSTYIDREKLKQDLKWNGILKDIGVEQ